jgi:hypothetical protein
MAHANASALALAGGPRRSRRGRRRRDLDPGRGSALRSRARRFKKSGRLSQGYRKGLGYDNIPGVARLLQFGSFERSALPLET